MQIINKLFSDLQINYPLDQLAPLGDILYIDIETTGFSSASSSLYLIGCAFYSSENHFTCKQFFAEKPEEEVQILREFNTFVSNFKTLIHYNGNNFDIPYIQDKCKKYNLDCPISDMNGIDLYKRISPYKNFLKVPNLKQKTMEQYIGINREDVFSGGDLIGVYQEYVQNFSVDNLAKLLLHNENDISGMIELTSILSYVDLFNKPITVTKVNMDSYNDFNGNERKELVMKLHFSSNLPTSISHMASECFFKGEGNEGILKVPVYEEELKYFYANYKDYYYLPEEDEALHKSVASFVDKDHRKQATAATCYTRMFGLFLPQFAAEFTPFFKKEYKDKNYFVELTKERKKDRSFFSEYASHIICAIGQTN